MPFLLAEILNFQGSTHHIGVGSFSKMSKKTLEELAALLDFVKADLAGIEADYEDPFVEQLQNSVRRIKKAEETIT